APHGRVRREDPRPDRGPRDPRGGIGCVIRARERTATWRAGVLLAGALALAACSGPGPVRIDVPPAPGAMFDFQDMRPAEQRSDRGRFDANDGRIMLAERDLVTPPAAPFRSWLTRKLPHAFSDRALVLYSVVVLVANAM